jgi:hypothetical protein
MRAAPLSAILLLASCGRTEAERGAVVTESWSVVMLQGQRIGHTHTLRSVKSGEVDTFVQAQMTLKRMGTEIKVNTDTRHVETTDGKALRFSAKMAMSDQPTLREGVIENGRLKFTTDTGGKAVTKETAWEPDWLLSEGARLLMVKSGFTPGTKYKYKSFNAEYGMPDETSVEVEGVETRTVLGKEQKLARLKSVPSLAKGVVSTSWVDEQGFDRMSEVSMMGMTIVFRASTKEDALRAPVELPEVFLKSMPRSNVALPRPREITTLTVRMERPDGGLAEWKPPESTQEVRARDDKSLELAIQSEKLRSGGLAEDLAVYLKPSPSVQCDDAEIVKTAREIAGAEKDPARLAGKLAGWVHDHIDKKSMDVGAASAREVFQNRSGDCSEHAVLLAAMLRAANIPAKVCSGYLYFRGNWGGHAWTSAWIGRWVDFDATLGGRPADAARIKFSETDAQDSGALMEGMRGAGFMHGGMKIEIVEYMIDGKRVKAAPPGAPAGNRFESPLLGLSFEKPGDWVFRDSKELPPFALAAVDSPDKGASAVLKYHDLPYEFIPLDMKKLARKLGAPSSGEVGRLDAFETYESDERLFVRIAPGEVVEVALEEGKAARPAMDRFKKTLKISR